MSAIARLLLLGVVFHAIYVLSIFDIYFTSPIVHHVESFRYNTAQNAPAKRMIVFVADGCRADKFYEANATKTQNERVSFLRHVIQATGSYGVSHTRVPTESRPGHVALFAGMYEDVSAVTKGWQDNPVEFDSVFNHSTHAWLFGSPDIVPMFAKNIPQAHEVHYSHEQEDFATDASTLDVWVYDQFKQLIASASHNATLHAQLHADGVLFFCHFLGIDTNGHAHRPQSSDYLNNIALVDELVEKVVQVVEDFYDYDGQTAFLFTADHGMSNKGAHGDGDPANTRTPLVVWGAGVQGPTPKPSTTSAFEIELPTQSKADVLAQLRAQPAQETVAQTEWGNLTSLVRKDVMQADIAPLISSLLGLPYPRNSVGVLPFTYLQPGVYRARAVKSNAQQLYLHALRKEQEKEARTLLFFQPFRPFRTKVKTLLAKLETAWDAQAFDQVETISQELIAICLETLEYFQRYDWFFLLSTIVLGYIGWILVLVIVVIAPQTFAWRQLMARDDPKLWFLQFGVAVFLLLENSPVTYYLYVSFPIVFWNFVWNRRIVLLEAMTWRHEWFWIAICLELVVVGYERRWIFAIVFVLLGLMPLVERTPNVPIQWTLSCLVIAIFPLLPTEYGEHTLLVQAGGLVLVLAASQLIGWRHQLTGLLVGLLIASMVTLQLTMGYLEAKTKPPTVLTLANWFLAIVPITCYLVASRDHPTQSLVLIALALAPSYLLLSISYEVLFYVALCGVLYAWQSIASSLNPLRRSFFFLLLIKIAFFGTGNVASMSSFEISSTYRFVTVFSPFLMGTLLVLKILIPFLLVACAFQRLVAKDQQMEAFVLVVMLSDVLALQFLFLVKNEGSWKEIGNSISMYGIVNAQIVFIPLLFGVANLLVKSTSKPKFN